LKPGIQTLDLQLKVALPLQKVTVQENAGPSVTTDPGNNASALVLRGDDLQALANCHSVRRSRSLTRIPTGCICCDRGISMRHSLGPLTHRSQAAAYCRSGRQDLSF